MAWPRSEDSDSDPELDVLGVLETWVVGSSETEGAWTLLLLSLMMVDSSGLEAAWLLLLISLILLESSYNCKWGVDKVADI